MKERVGVSWDSEFLYVEGNGLPDHGMMTGITAWQQQVPIPHDFTAGNAFKLPLEPALLERPEELTLIGPIAIAVNGIPIFNALTQSGKDAYAAGELTRPHLDRIESQRLKNISSLAFGGPDLKTVYLGCLLGAAGWMQRGRRNIRFLGVWPDRATQPPPTNSRPIHQRVGQVGGR